MRFAIQRNQLFRHCFIISRDAFYAVEHLLLRHFERWRRIVPRIFRFDGALHERHSRRFIRSRWKPWVARKRLPINHGAASEPLNSGTREEGFLELQEWNLLNIGELVWFHAN